MGKAVSQGRYGVQTLETWSDRPRDLSSNLLAQGVVSQVLCPLHNDPSAGHLGISKTLEKVQRRFYWHGMQEDVKMHVRRCVPCAEVNDTCKLPKAPLINTKAGHPLQRVAIYIVGPTPRSTSGHEWLVVVSNHFTKFAQVFPVRNTSVVTQAKKVMDEYMCRFGCFKGLHSDQGANVDGAVFKRLWFNWRSKNKDNAAPSPRGWAGTDTEQISGEDP